VTCAMAMFALSFSACYGGGLFAGGTCGCEGMRTLRRWRDRLLRWAVSGIPRASDLVGRLIGLGGYHSTQHCSTTALQHYTITCVAVQSPSIVCGLISDTHRNARHHDTALPTVSPHDLLHHKSYQTRGPMQCSAADTRSSPSPTPLLLAAQYCDCDGMCKWR